MRYFDEWTPDTTESPNKGLVDCNNVYVKGVEEVSKGVFAHDYAPIGVPAYLPTTALNARCQGGISYKDETGTVFNFAGDATKLYLFQSGVATNISRTVGGAYATSTVDMWRFAIYGNRIIATNGTDTPQTYVVGTSTHFENITGAPIAKNVCTVKDFVVFSNTQDSQSELHWSGIDQPTSYPTPGSGTAQEQQSDIQIMQTGDSVMGVIGGVAGVDAIVIMESSVWTMNYEAYPTIFGFKPMDRARGAIASGSIVNQGQFVCFIAKDGFYAFDGTQVKQIGVNKVNKWFNANLNDKFPERITSMVDPINQLVIWSFPSTASLDGTPDTLLVWNWAFDKWSKTSSISHELIYLAMSEGYTLEGLSSFGNLDTLPFSLDSRAWKGGQSLLSLYNPTDHSYGYISSTNALANIQTGYEFIPNGQMTQISGVRVTTDSPVFKAQVYSKKNLSDSAVISTLNINNDNGVVPARASGRNISFNIVIPEGETWTHLSGYEVTSKLLGRR